MNPGHYEIELDGGSLASGIYFYQIQAGNYKSTRKMVINK